MNAVASWGDQDSVEATAEMKVYIAGPYTKGDVALNVRRAILAGDEVFGLGHIPFVPHLTHFWHFISPHPYDDWCSIDNAWVPLCDVVLRLDGESVGADKEVELAESLGIRVVSRVEDI